MCNLEIVIPLSELYTHLLKVALIHGKLPDKLQMVGCVLDVMPGTVFELKSCRAPKPVKFALHLTERTETVLVLVKVTKPDIRDGTPIRAVHGTIRTVRIMSGVKITSNRAIADLTLMVAILAFSAHVS